MRLFTSLIDTPIYDIHKLLTMSPGQPVTIHNFKKRTERAFMVHRTADHPATLDNYAYVAEADDALTVAHAIVMVHAHNLTLQTQEPNL
jgi:hypothetical protein